MPVCEQRIIGSVGDVAEDYGLCAHFPIVAEGNDATSVPIDLATVQRTDIRNHYHSALSELAQAIRQYLVHQENPESAKKAADTSAFT